MPPESFETVCNWIIKAWKSLNIELIQKSFRSCGTGLAVDSFEHGKYPALKNGNPYAGGLKILEEKMNKLQS